MPPPIILRPVLEADLPVFFEHQLDPDAVRMSTCRPRAADAFFAHWDKIRADASNVLRTIVVGDEVTGNIVSWAAEGKRQLGYWIGKAFWGRGIATAAVAQFLRLVTERPLHASAVGHNVGSIRVLEKCGFRIIDREVIDDADSLPCEGVLLRLDGDEG